MFASSPVIEWVKNSLNFFQFGTHCNICIITLCRWEEASKACQSFLFPHYDNSQEKEPSSCHGTEWTMAMAMADDTEKKIEIKFAKSRTLRARMRTLFENYWKWRIWIFQFCHFPPICVLLKLTCLVTLFDRKLQVCKNSPKWTIFGIFKINFCSLKM